MKAVVLAAGFATRMYPLTRTRAKPLLEVAGAPLITHILRRVEQVNDVSEAIVVSNGRFYEDFQRWAKSAEFRMPVRLIDDGTHEDHERLGAVRDMALAMDSAPGEDYLVVAGDNFLELDLSEPARIFGSRREPLLLLRSVDARGARPYNAVDVDTDGRVTRFVEKPTDSNSAHAAICLYFFPAEVRSLVSRYLDGGGNADSPGYFIEWLVDQVPVRSTTLSGRWFDIGSLEGLEHARAELG